MKQEIHYYLCVVATDWGNLITYEPLLGKLREREYYEQRFNRKLCKFIETCGALELKERVTHWQGKLCKASLIGANFVQKVTSSETGLLIGDLEEIASDDSGED